MIVHKSIDTKCLSNYTVSEFYTGMYLTFGKTKQDAINDALKRERNIENWKSESNRIIYNNDMVLSAVKEYGYANNQ